METNAKLFLSEPEKKRLLDAIQRAEDNTSGEIRVHFENHCKGDVLDRAAAVFARLGMVKTLNRNGVLFYVAVHSHKFAIIGDAGINAKVPPQFWEGLKEGMLLHFKDGNFVTGLEIAIDAAGTELKKYFPWQTTDVNELPDTISTSTD